MPKLTDQTRNRNPAINNILTAGAPSQQGQKTSYQQNVSQPTETKWYSGSTPTVREVYTQMWKQGQSDPQGLSTAFGTFIQMQDDPSSPYFNPYRKATNKAVSTLKDMGIDTSNIDDDWFRQTADLENYLHYDGTTNAPSKPGNKASTAEKAAYERYQIGKANDLTRQAQNEWAAMQEEIDYWTSKSGRNYSDDEIIDKIYGKDNANLAKKYPTLAKMEASLQTGKDILELNAGIGYSKDNAYTAIWRSRNDGGTGDWDVDALLMATGQYNGYVEDPDIIARRTDGSAFYAPYTLGSTMEDACLYYGKPNFTTEEIASMKPDGSDKTEGDLWNALYEADKFTVKAEDELAKFNKRLDKQLEEATDPNKVMEDVNRWLGKDYKTLKELDDSTKLVNGLKDTTRAIDYSYNDVLRKVQEKCAENKIKPTPVEKVTESVGEQPQLTAQEVELSKVKDQNIRDGYEIGEGNFTSAEDAVMRNAGSSMWNFMRGIYTDAMDRLDAGRQMVQNNINDTSKTYVQDYLGNARTVANYNTVSDNYARDSEALADYQRRFGNLADYYDEFEERKQSQLDDGTTVNMHYDADKKEYVLDSIGMMVPEELKIYDEGSAERQLLQQAQDLVSLESARIQDIQYAHARLQYGGKEIQDEIKRYGQLTASVEYEKNYLQKHDAEYEKSQNILNDAETEMTIIGMASSFLGADVGGLQNARAMTDYLVGFVDQPPLPRSNETKLQSIMGIFDVTGKEATNEEVSGIIAQGKEQIQNEMKLIEDMLAYADETGIEIPANVRKNMEFKLEDYQKELEGFNYASILVDVDPAEVDKAVEAGRAFEEKYGEGNMHYWTELFQENGEFYTLKYQQRYTSPEGETYRDVVTEDDEKTYYYLLGKKVLEMGDSLDEAIGRINVDPEGTRAAVHEAFSDAKQYQQFMEDEVWAVREYDLSVAYGEQLAKDAPGLANIMATMVTPGEAFASILEIIDTAVTGRRFNSKSMAGRFTGAKNAIREETRAAIDETFKDKPVAAKIANIGYEIYCNRGDSMMNALAFGWMFGGAGGMAGEFLGSVPMGTTAALSAAAEAIENGASTEQAWLIAGATFLAETVTEAVTLSNIQEAFGTGKELTKESVKDFFREWITKNGAEEAFGETLNNVIERAASRWAERMDPEGNYASDHQRLVEKYITQGKNPDEAEQLAQMDELKDDLHTAIVSYLSAGTDVFVKTGKAAINSANYYRTATRAAQQLGDSRSMLRHMLDDHQARKNAPAGSATTTTTTKGNQTVDSIEADVEDVDIDFPAAATEETADVEPAVAAEQQAQQEAETAQKTAYAKDLEVLTSAMKTGITSSATAGISAVLKMDGSDLSVDRANAAAVRAGDVFTGGIKELRGILAGGANANVDNNAVKMGIIQAILGGEESESYKIVQSEEFKNASDEQKAAMLAQTGDTDAQNESVQQAVNRIIQETRVAEVTRDAISEGMLNGAKEAQATAEQAAADARQAEEDLATRQSETQAADDARVAATEAAVQNPGDANAVKAKQAAEANMRSKVEVEQEYEQKRQKAEEKKAEAERKAKAQFDEDMATIRGQSQETVAQADQQRAEAAAQQAEAQQIAEEQAQQAQAEEDQRSGKADEDKTRKLAEDWANTMRLEGDERDSFIQRVVDRQEQKALGKIDLTGKVSNAEGYLAISAFSRKTGMQFELSNDLPDGTRGKYQNGKVYLNANLVRSGQMTIGQALVEASLHEMTHSMEMTRNYRTYRKTVLDSLFGDKNNRNQAAYDAAIDTKIADYKKIGQNLTKAQAEQEIVADFARTHLAEKEVVQRFMDAGLGGKMRNSLHNINQALKNFFGGLKGEERKTAEYLRKAERAYQKALNEAAKTAVHPEGGQFSVQQFAEAAGLFYNDQIIKGENGEEYAPGLYTSDPSAKGAKATRVTEVTPDMIRKTPMGMLIDLAENGMKNKKGDVITNPTIDKETADKQRKMFADLMTMTANYQNSDLVWEIAGSTLYSALKENADTQYSNTVDFGTICAKTQEIVNVLSRVMQEKVKLGKGGGLTRAEVLKVYNETAKAGLTVPCPVCYVFSRWMGVPSLLGQMSQYQKDYVVLDDPNDLDSINWEETQKVANDYIKKEIEKYGSFEAAKDAKNTLADELDKQESKRIKAAKILISEKATEEQKAEAQKDHDDAVAESVRLEEEIGKAEAFNWVTQALCKQVRVNGKDVNVIENGVYLVDDTFRMTPDSVIFDLRQTGEFAKYAKNWGYRNSRGASMGKAIMPYSGEDIGDIIHGTTRWTKDQNPFKNNNPQKAANAIKDAMARVAKQNLIGGQRLQSTSDFRPEWGLDYMMTYLELQAIGSKVQMYTKVAEAVDLLASMGGDINLSIMGAGKGWHIDENGQYVLDFSDVTGMKYETARALKDKYSNVQMILVGMNDKHIQLALGDSDIDFVIPWHSSGNTKDALASMIASVGEKLETSDDYQNCQSDKRSKNQTPEQAQLWDLRIKILTGKDLTEEERKTIYGDKYLKRLYTRFNLEGEDVQKAIENDEFLRKHYERLGSLKDNDCYGVSLNGPQANQIFPYEYWDTSLTKDQADENGWNFIQYCQHFGIVPRFSGANQKNEDGKTKRKIGNFAGAVYDAEGADGKNILGYDKSKMTPGYWKLLIDRPMYDNDGNYRDQQVVNVTNARVGNLSAPDEHGTRHLENSDMPIRTSAKYTSDKVIDPDLMSQEDEAVYNSMVTLTGAKPYRVTGQASFYGDMTDADIDQMLAQADEDYMNAAKRGDKEAAQEAVDFAAEQAGFTDEVYHGTDFTHGFGFTKFDMNESQGEIFVAYDDVLSGTYTRTRANVREISQGVRDIWDLSDEELFELAYERLKTIENENGKVVKARVMMNGNGEFVLRTEPETYGENWSERIITRDELENELSDVYYAMQREGIYHFYAHPGRQLVIDANDENWNHIQIDDAEVENDIMMYFHGYDSTEDNHFTTRQIADYAKARGYDSVRINNVYDNGGRSQRRTDGMDGYGDIGIFFHPEAVKSADPITYDDNGEIIPLNQRFNRKNDDIRYSAGGEITDADIDQMLSANGLTPQLSTEQNEDLPGMPAGNGKAQRQYGHKTAQESDAIHQEVKDYLYTHSDYDPETNQEQIGRAMDWVRSNASEGDEDGYRASLDEVLSPGFDYRSADGQARMLTVMGMAALKAESGDRSALNDELRLNDAYNGQGTDIGRMLQARKIFRLMTPLGRRQALLNEVNRINTDFANRGKDTQVRLSDWTLKAAENAQSEQDFEKVQKAAEAELASQIPANWKEKLQTWRMLSMLGNPRTHIRNYVGNWIFKPAVAMKNIIATGLENRYLKDGDERTKAIRYTDDAKAFAAQDVETMRDVLTGEAKYAPENRIERQKKVFGQKNGIISRTLGQFVQGASDFNSFLLEAEDWVFLNKHYQNALASYMTANKLTSEDMTGKTLEKAREYAILEAQKATYRDANEISDSLNKISRGGGVKGFLLDTVLPFKKTPANILRRGIEYSPVGLVKSLVTAKKSVDLYNSWAENGFKGTMPKGAKSMNQALDSIAAGMTGTMIAALGMLGYALGAVKLGFGKEDDDELKQERGSQEYSIELFGQSVTIDWAAPVCMPFFLGASLWQNIAENNGNVTLGSAVNSVMGIAEPVFNLSMLDGVNSLLETAKYSTNKNSLPIGDLLQKIGANYVGSLFPALGGAWARTIDNTRRKNFIQSGDEMSIWSGMLEQAQNKIPGLSFYNIPYRNVWGEADVTPRGEAFLENFVLPGYINHMKEDKLVDELQRIYDQTGDKSVIPKAAGKTVGDIKLTDKQYDQYVVTRGQTAKKLLNELIERPEFLALTPTELSPGNPEAQVQLIGEVWKYANAIARHEIDPSYDIGKNGKWIAGAYARGDVIDTIFANEEAKAQTENANAAKADLVTAINGEDADAIGASVEALKRAGKTDEQIRKNVMDDFRDMYKEACRTGDTATMERIETGMLILDLGEKSFTDPEEDKNSIFNKWRDAAND